jgi:transaldolase
MSNPTEELAAVGVSIWFDDLSRTRITSGNLRDLIQNRAVTGVTTNPTIFANAITNPDDTSYDAQVKELAASGATAEEAVFAAITQDVTAALDILRPVWQASGGVDGRVSIEVSPDLAHDTEATIAQALELWQRIDRENLMVKIPATRAGLPAITAVIAAGVSVNVTLIFSLTRYAEVIDAYLTGLEQARDAGLDLSKIHSVASFFVSRVDTETDKRLDALGTDAAAAIKGMAGLANARLAYELFEQKFADERALALLAVGANVQRPLWASTGVKDPALPDTLYVTELAAAGVVNTMPEATLEAVYDHGVITGDTITGNYEQSRGVFTGLAAVGIEFDDITALLEQEGVAKFIASWQSLLAQVEEGLQAHT